MSTPHILLQGVVEARLQVAQKAWITDADRLLMVQYGHTGQHHRDLPGGRVDHGETDLDDALIREIKEETGLSATVGATLAVCLDTHPGNGALTLYLIRAASVLPAALSTTGQTPQDNITAVAWIPRAAIATLTLGPAAFAAHARRLAAIPDREQP